jgi:hypothetical protein
MVETLCSTPLGLSDFAGPCTRGRARQLALGTDFCNSETSSVKPAPGNAPCSLGLHVRWTAEDGTSRAARLPLASISGVGDLRGLFRRLLLGAFPSRTTAMDGLPEYLTSQEYYKFTPAEDFVSLPGDAVRTQFRLVATIDGWEVTVAERELGGPSDPERRLVVTVAEFESEPVNLPDGRQMVVSLVAYPTVCVQRSFLDDALVRLTTEIASPSAASSFQGGFGLACA